jgi:hypothetical protein
MTLETWHDKGRLATHNTSAAEIQQLWTIVRRDIADASAQNISTDRRFMAAYNAALQIATITLHCRGYRARSPGHHYTTFQVLPDVLGGEYEDTAAYFDTCRSKRNRSQYDRSGEISETEITELLEVVTQFRDDVCQWVMQEHPDLAADESDTQ